MKRSVIGSIMFVLALCVIFSCRPSQKLCNKCYPPKESIRDSIDHSVEWIKHDSSTTIPGDSAWYKLWIDCQKDKDGNWKPVIINQQGQQGKNIEIQTEYENSIFYVTAKIDSLKVFWSYWDKYVKDSHFKYVVKSEQVVYIPWYIKALAFIGGIVLGIAVIYYAWKCIKFYLLKKPF